MADRMNPETTSEKSEALRTVVSVARMAGIETACEVLGDKGGKKIVADTLGISVRALFDKRQGETSITDLEVRILARELAKVAERCARVSENLLKEIAR